MRSRKRQLLVMLATIVLTTFLTSTSIRIALGQPPIITVATDESKYGLSDTVRIDGNLTVGGTPVGDGIVGVEVRDSANLPLIFRTRPTGTIATDNWLINITQIYTADSSGNPKHSFAIGNNLYIFCSVKNLDDFPHNVMICITIYGANMVPIGSWYPSNGTIEAGNTKEILFFATKIDTTMASGTATVYANAYSNFPNLAGYPWCPEKTATFTITGTTLSIQQTFTVEYTSTLADGTYSVSFKLPREWFLGTYNVYVSTFYAHAQAYTSTTFEVVLIGDINGDDEVNILDAILLAKAYPSAPGDPNWNPNADLNESGNVDVLDAILLAKHFGDKAV